MLKLSLPLFLALIAFPLSAEQYQSIESFLSEAFPEAVPPPKVLWLNKELRQTTADILQHKPGFLRTRYWQHAQRRVWILNEIGKTQPITVGVIIQDNRIETLRVLAFRESRGWEVKHDFFTDQFKQLHLVDDLRLNQRIDGISGATLSVKALTKIARLALYFNQYGDAG